VRITITVTASGGDDSISLTTLKTILDFKMIADQGSPRSIR